MGLSNAMSLHRIFIGSRETIHEATIQEATIDDMIALLGMSLILMAA